MPATPVVNRSSNSGIIPRVGVISPGSFVNVSASVGLDQTLDFFLELEQLDYDFAGIRQRHLELGSSSALTFLAAASQRTSTISLETNVVPIGYEVPFRLAEDFATVAALSGDRLNIGVSSSAPHFDTLAALSRPDLASDTDSYELIDRFLEALRGQPLHNEFLTTPYGSIHPPTIHPHIPGLNENVWIGSGSDRSALWAAERRLGIFLGNLTDAVGDAGFEESQRERIDQYIAASEGHGTPRVAVERVLLPLDSATPDQKFKYREFAAKRFDRTREAHGERRTLIQPDLVGYSHDIIEKLHNDPVFDGNTQLRVSLPYAFSSADYLQIVTDIREHILPELGWVPLRSVDVA